MTINYFKLPVEILSGLWLFLITFLCFLLIFQHNELKILNLHQHYKIIYCHLCNCLRWGAFFININSRSINPFGIKTPGYLCSAPSGHLRWHMHKSHVLSFCFLTIYKSKSFDIPSHLLFFALLFKPDRQPISHSSVSEDDEISSFLTSSSL